MIVSCQESYDRPTQCIEKQGHYSADKDSYSQGYGLPQWSQTLVKAGQ